MEKGTMSSCEEDTCTLIKFFNCIAVLLRKLSVVEREGVEIALDRASVAIVAVVVGSAALVVAVAVGGAFMPVLPVQSYNFGCMHPNVKDVLADGHVTEPCELGQH